VEQMTCFSLIRVRFCFSLRNLFCVKIRVKFSCKASGIRFCFRFSRNDENNVIASSDVLSIDEIHFFLLLSREPYVGHVLCPVSNVK